MNQWELQSLSTVLLISWGGEKTCQDGGTDTPRRGPTEEPSRPRRPKGQAERRKARREAKEGAGPSHYKGNNVTSPPSTP
eukprot:5548314-Pyramimonas_sp.AAC.1